MYSERTADCCIGHEWKMILVEEGRRRDLIWMFVDVISEGFQRDLATVTSLCSLSSTFLISSIFSVIVNVGKLLLLAY